VIIQFLAEWTMGEFDDLAVMLEPVKKIYNLSLADGSKKIYPGRSYKCMNELIDLEEEQYEKKYIKNPWADVEAVLEARSESKAVEPMDVFTPEFFNLVDLSYKSNLRDLLAEDARETAEEEEEWEQRYYHALEVYLNDVVKAATPLAKCSDEEEENQSDMFYIKSTLLSKLVYRLQPGGKYEIPKPLMTATYWDDIHKSFKENALAIAEVSLFLHMNIITCALGTGFESGHVVHNVNHALDEPVPRAHNLSSVEICRRRN